METLINTYETKNMKEYHTTKIKKFHKVVESGFMFYYNQNIETFQLKNQKILFLRGDLNIQCYESLKQVLSS
ncbi:hypothetical protein [Falsibacillus albus]|uniref:Uncharacterized protein n=1 Tax=Falsibacillus albus TaxID=2478915 RepID=A0A3L7K0N0_9BACI|nr:hypothetical protein [Falsibacillus albus]RLQ96613.1 hypothetical protein D9X91_05770 [Falsibacillus albus]